MSPKRGGRARQGTHCGSMREPKARELLKKMAQKRVGRAPSKHPRKTGALHCRKRVGPLTTPGLKGMVPRGLNTESGRRGHRKGVCNSVDPKKGAVVEPC